jgi:tetratricopeptide (TPR) repeat protein
LNALARAQLGRGRYAEAEVHYREALAIFRRHHGWEHKSIAQVLQGLMSALRAKGDQAGADSLIRHEVADATSRVEREPDNPAAWLRRGTILVALGQLTDAEAAFREALRLDPDRPVHHDALGDVLLRQGRLSESEAALRNGIRLKPDAGKIHTRLGLVLWNQGRTEEALASLRKAVDVDPESSWAWQVLGWTRYRAGAWEDSIKALETSCNLEPGGTGDCGQWIVLALAHWRLAGQKDLSEQERARHRREARRWYDQAIKQTDGIHGQVEVMPAVRAFREEAAELLDGKGPE